MSSHPPQVIRGRACLGSIPGACDASDWNPLNIFAMESIFSVAGKADGVTYYATVEITNGAGNYQLATSNGFRIDVKVRRKFG